MPLIFLSISTVIAVISPIVYITAILKGQAKPHRTTRITIMVINIISTASLFLQHNTVAIWLAAIGAIQGIIIFLLSLKYGMGGWAKSDILCLVIALAGIVLWQITSDPVIALYCAIGADITGMIPTLIKTYKTPQSEIWQFYSLDVVASFFTLLAITSFTLQEIAYPIYIFLINLVMVVLIFRLRLLKKLKH